MSMSSYDRRPRWRDAVLASTKLRPLTKLILIVTADYMKRDGKVTVERETVAARLSLNHVQRVSEGWKQACDHEFLKLVHKGSFGGPSTYEGLVIHEPSVTANPVTASDRHTRSLESPQIRSLPSDRESGHYYLGASEFSVGLVLS
jgi:hypothetical protein